MAYQRPTVAQLMEQQSVDLSAQLNIAQSQIARSNAGVIAKVQAGGLHGLYGYLGYLINQQFEDTADDEYLARRASIRGIPKKLATKASGQRVVTGSVGGEIPAGAVLQRADGMRYIVQTGVVMGEESAAVLVEAERIGALSNTDETEALQFITPIAGIKSESLTGAISGGTDDESIENHRSRVLADIKEPPHGGASRDYIKWAQECPGVDVGKVWPQRKWMGRGTVGVFFVLQNGDIPSAEQVQTVQSYIEIKAPVTADVYVIAPVPATNNIEISGLLPDTPAVRAAITAELDDLFRRSAKVEDGTGVATVLLSHIREAVSIAAGEGDHAISAPTANIAFSKGQLPHLGIITWT